MYKLLLPGEERDASRKARITPLYDLLASRGAVYAEANGWERPKWFSLDGRIEEIGFRHNNTFAVVAEECRAVRERVGVLELSSFAKYDVVGKDAEQFLNRISANTMPLREGGITLTHYLSETGRINGESTITRLGQGRYYVLSGATSEERDLAILTQGIADGEAVTITNITNDLGVIIVVGPKSRQLLASLTESDLSNPSFPWLTGKEIEIAGHSVRALRVNYVGELGWELHCPMANMLGVYEAVWAAGEAHGIANFGTYAMNSLRIEKAYKGWGAELTNEISMVEADAMRFFSKKKENFIGRQATLGVVEKGIAIKLVYFEVEAGDNDVVGGETVLHGDRVIGVTTSGGYGHTTQRSLGFAYVEPEHAEVGSEFDIYLLGELRKATVLGEPVWDPANERLRV